MVAITQIDAFTSEPFRGNPAAVCILPSEASAEWMQSVAAEMNLSETAFLSPQDDGYRLRWFTPAVEVDLCGHATLASAHALWEQHHIPEGATAIFHTNSGKLTATNDGDWIMLDFPREGVEQEIDADELSAILEIPLRGAWRNRFDILVEAESDEAVRTYRPDFTRLQRIDCRGIILTSSTDDPTIDFVSRFFGPAVGINEDPVTGSAHCFLGPFWADRLGKTELIGYQASERGGIVRVNVRGDRVGIGGQAVTVLDATLRV